MVWGGGALWTAGGCICGIRWGAVVCTGGISTPMCWLAVRWCALGDVSVYRELLGRSGSKFVGLWFFSLHWCFLLRIREYARGACWWVVHGGVHRRFVVCLMVVVFLAVHGAFFYLGLCLNLLF